MIWYLFALFIEVIVDTTLTISQEVALGRGFSFILVMHVINSTVWAYSLFYLFQKKKDQEREAKREIQAIGQRQKETQGALSSVLHNLPGAVNVISPYFVIQQMNEEVRKITGVNKKQALGKKCFDVFGDGNICPNCPVKKALKTRQVEKHVKRVPSRKDTEIYVELTAIPLLNLEGNVKNVVEIILDITQEVKLKQEQKEAFVQMK